jgi:hypothetical protein
MSECQCVMPDGAVKLFCERHQCFKYTRQCELCKLGSQGALHARDYWRAWEKKRGPGQVAHKTKAPKPVVPKCRVGSVIKRLIKEEYLKWHMPPPKGCMGCGGRASVIDRWSCEECRERLEEIVNLLMTGAKEQKWIGGLVSMFSGTAESKARDIALRAIAEEEERLRQIAA